MSFWCWALFAALGAARADDFAAANAAFAEGKFEDARSGYEQVLADGWRANALFNLGNTHFRLGQPGRAALNYERALAVEPQHADAAANLGFVRTKSGGRALAARWFEKPLALPSAPWLAVTLATLGWLWAGFAVWRRGLGGIIGGTLLVLAGAALGAGHFWMRGRAEKIAIVVEQADARREPADRATLAEALPPGSSVRVVSEQGDWFYAELPGGQKGWLKAGAAEYVVPPAFR